MAFTILAIVFGCTTGSVCQTGKSLSAAPPLLKFQKTPCFGTCPSYEATIQEDGTITFIGWEHVPVKDTLQVCLPQKDLKQLKSNLAALDYTSMQSSYLTQWSDMPSTYLTFYQNGKEVKRIKHQEGGPEELLKFQEKLNKTILTLVEQQGNKE